MAGVSTIVRALRSFKVPQQVTQQIKELESFVEQMNRVGRTPFTLIVDRLEKVDFSTSKTIEIPELGISENANSPVQNLLRLQEQAKNLPRTQVLVSKLKQYYDENSPTTIAKKSNLANPPSDESFFDLSNKEHDRPIDWEFYKKKGVPEADIQKLQSYLKDELSEDKLSKERAEIFASQRQVAGLLDKALQEILSSWAFQPGNLQRLLDQNAAEKEQFQFYMTASVDQVLEKHPKIAEEIDKKILNREWAAFAAHDDPGWEAADNFVPRYPKDVRREHEAHGHGHGEKKH